MGIVIILKNMSVIFLMALIGFVLFKKGILEENTNKKLSMLVVDICNPALTIACIIEDKISATHREITQAVVISIMIYGILILLGSFLPKILRVERGRKILSYDDSLYECGIYRTPFSKSDTGCGCHVVCDHF